jgi:hypothetical protein
MISLYNKMGGFGSLFSIKNLIYLLFSASFLFGGFKIYRIFFPSSVPLDIPQNDLLPTATISEDDAILLANQLHSFMDRLGTDEDSIQMILDRINENDLILIYSKFGLREYRDGFQTLAIKQNLNAWFQGEFMPFDDTFKKYKNLAISANLW